MISAMELEPRWLVKHRGGWCAAKINQKHDEAAWSVKTLCNHFVMLPLGTRFGTPNCRDCLAIMECSASPAAAEPKT